MHPSTSSIVDRQSATPPSVSTPQLSAVNPLRLPNPDDQEAWTAINSYFSSILVPRLLSLDDPDTINNTLAESIYTHLSEIHGTYTSKSPTSSRRRKKHDRVVKGFREIKNTIRREYRKALHSHQPVEVIQKFSKDFRTTMKQHARARKQSLADDVNRNAQLATAALKRNFWGYVNHLLGGNCTPSKPSFTANDATEYFRVMYSQVTRKTFESPVWLPTPKLAEFAFDTGPFMMDEIILCIKKSRPKSKPCPFDEVSYYILKKSPSLLPALLHLYNKAWLSLSIPEAWQRAAISLIPKESAQSDPSNPKNFRPIALTSCIGKIFTSIVKHRWDDFMLSNGFLDTTVQKAFQHKTSGCEEHQLKLWSVLKDANINQRSLTVA